MHYSRKLLSVPINPADSELPEIFAAPMMSFCRFLLPAGGFLPVLSNRADDKKRGFCTTAKSPSYNYDFFLHRIKLCYICIVHMHCPEEF